MLPILQTSRLVLHEVSEADCEDIFLLNSDPKVMHYILPPAKGKEEIMALIRMSEAYYLANPGFGVWKMSLHNGTFLGLGILNHIRPTRDIQIGYRLHTRYWGNGYATEIAHGLLKYGFEKKGLDLIHAVSMPENKASLRVMQKVGMSPLGLTTKYYGEVMEAYSIQKEAYYAFLKK